MYVWNSDLGKTNIISDRCREISILKGTKQTAMYLWDSFIKPGNGFYMCSIVPIHCLGNVNF